MTTEGPRLIFSYDPCTDNYCPVIRVHYNQTPQVNIHIIPMILSLTVMSFQDHEDEENPESQSPPDRALQPAEVPCEATRLD